MEASQALILAGGLGTRLRSVVSGLPKVLAPVGGRPFLDYLLLQLRKDGICEVTLCVGYKSELVRAHVGDGGSWDLSVRYSHEDRPLGTGGALRLALDALGDGPFIVMNGDTFFDISLRELWEKHGQSAALGTLALATGAGERYAAVEVDDAGRILTFHGKGPHASDTFNGGIYVLDRSIVSTIATGTAVSLERDIFPSLVGSLHGEVFDRFFVDIGVPDDFQRTNDDPTPILRALS
jgi:NDP-sugar pyrophosphorylase family protein